MNTLGLHDVVPSSAKRRHIQIDACFRALNSADANSCLGTQGSAMNGQVAVWVAAINSLL